MIRDYKRGRQCCFQFSILLLLAVVLISVFFRDLKCKNYTSWENFEFSDRSQGSHFYELGRNRKDWKEVEPETMTLTELNKYFSFRNLTSCNLTQYFGGELYGDPERNIVFIDGHKPICLDNNIAPKLENCLVYSFGINEEWSFDHAMHRYGCQVFSFDPSMNVIDHNHTRLISFYRMGLDSIDGIGWKGNLNVPMKTLSSIFQMLVPIHGANAIIDYLKIDIEAFEYHVIPQIISSGMLNRVRQLNIDVHHFYNLEMTIEEYRKQFTIIKLLEDYGMIRFESLPLPGLPVPSYNYTVLGFVGPGAYEISWFNSKILPYNDLPYSAFSKRRIKKKLPIATVG